jgi:quercetin dioxygenase-like cupin family protein
MKVEKWDKNKWGELTKTNTVKKLESEGYSVAEYVYPPGTYFPDHTHSFDKKDAVLKGRFKITILGQEVILEAGDMIEVPANTVHRAEVVGNEAVVSLDASKY